MFRLIWFLIGLAIGSWLLQPVKRQQQRPAPPRGANGTAARYEAVPPSVPSIEPPKPPAPAARSLPPAPTASDGLTDDPLIDIKGIGPASVVRLHELGIRTFAQLAAEDPDALAQRMGGRFTGERIRRERWIEQAREFLEK